MPSIIGWIKNGRKGKNLAYMPASYPSERVAYGDGSVKDALDGLNASYTSVDHSGASISNNTEFIAPENGFIYILMDNTVGVVCSASVKMDNGNFASMFQNQIGVSTTYNPSYILPVEKGLTYKVGLGGSSVAIFYKYKR